ncbi:MAG: DUF2793 domain-containing protein [Pigmentiphaga sp.]
MSNTPKTGILELSPTTPNQAIPVNVGGYAVIDQLMVPTVVRRDLTAAPSTPADGDMHIMASAWSGVTNAAAGRMVFWRSSSNNWTVIIPRVGWRVAVLSELDANGLPKVYGCTATGATSTWSLPEAGLTNPMTTSGDIIYGGASGAPTRLAAGTNGYVLTLASGVPSWAAASGGMTNPMTTSGDIIYGGSSGTPTRLAAGSNGQVLTLSGGVPTWSTAGGLSRWTEGLSTSAPNATVPVVSLSATYSSATDVDTALVPKGIGGFALDIADNTETGGNKRGARSADLQRYRSSASMVASGAQSFIGAGRDNTASGVQAAIAGGYSNTVSGESGFAHGESCLVQNSFGRAGGNHATTRNVIGADAWAATTFPGAIVGQAQVRRLPISIGTTDATQTTLTSNQGAAEATNQMALADSEAVRVKGSVVARQNTTGDMKTWDLSGSFKRGSGAGTIAAVGTPSVVVGDADSGASAWTVTLDADTTNGAVRVRVTGEASKTIRWVGHLEVVEVVG